MGKQWLTLFFWAPKSLQMVIAAMKLKDVYSLEEKFIKLVEENGGFEFYQAYRNDVDHILGGPITSWEIDRETAETVSDFFWGGLQNHCRW